MVKKVLLKTTQPHKVDAVFVNNIEPPSPLFTGQGPPVRYVCPVCRAVHIKNVTIDEVAEQLEAEGRVLIGCRCGAHLVVKAKPGATS